MTRGMMFAGGVDNAAPSQAVLLAGVTSWTVPDGVSSISAVAVQGGGDAVGTTLVVSGTTVLRAQNGARIGDGGGDGGGASANYINGGGGAGGYSGNGGNGGATTPNASTGYDGLVGSNGSGGGGGGGAGGSYFYDFFPALRRTVLPGNGAGVGLKGAGSNGSGGQAQADGYASAHPDGYPGSNGSEILYGGGQGGNEALGRLAEQGGALAYKNAIAVTAGQVLTVSIPNSRAAIRIIWGAGRSYPSNAGDA